MLLGQDSPDMNHEQFTELHLGNGKWSDSNPKFTTGSLPSERSKIPPKTGRNSEMQVPFIQRAFGQFWRRFSQFHIRTASLAQEISPPRNWRENIER